MLKKSISSFQGNIQDHCPFFHLYLCVSITTLLEKPAHMIKLDECCLVVLIRAREETIFNSTTPCCWAINLGSLLALQYITRVYGYKFPLFCFNILAMSVHMQR